MKARILKFLEITGFRYNIIDDLMDRYSIKYKLGCLKWSILTYLFILTMICFCYYLRSSHSFPLVPFIIFGFILLLPIYIFYKNNRSLLKILKNIETVFLGVDGENNYRGIIKDYNFDNLYNILTDKIDALREYIDIRNPDFLVYRGIRYRVLEMIKNIEETLAALIVLFPDEKEYIESLWFDGLSVKCVPVERPISEKCEDSKK